ncbi:MAG: T9SS type A sorting domain-containing protein, partial [Ignavibacteria bacterium]|nr:T9SS type A sorting domain-containing protein [Ignavibacteria bacterium]
MNQWNNFSAFFNGSAVEIRLFLGQTDHDVFIKIDEINVGEWYDGEVIESQCGPTDDRIASNQPATGRLLNIGCTAWIIPNGKFASAGHCLDGSSSTIVEFNVPLSLPGGTIQHPGPEDQYSVDVSTKIFTNGGVGNDWGVFEVFPNSITGLMPKEAQGAFWPLVQDLGPDSIRITGYGVDVGTANQTQQTHIGPNAGSSGTTMRYVTDTEGGNSGSPVIDGLTNNAVGVHTHGGCTSSGGNNNGTSTFHAAFWAAVDMGAGGCPVEMPSNPNPTSGQTGVPLNLAQLTWSNGTGANSNELYFGTNPASLSLVQSGALDSIWNITGVTFTYGTNYYWQVIEIGDSCNTSGPIWSFTTVQDPNLVIDTLFCDDFEAGEGNWTITNDGGTCVWEVFSPPYPNSYTLPATSTGGVLSADSDECGSGTTLLSTATLSSPIDATLYETVWLEFDNDWNAIDAADFCYVDVSTDGGTTWQNVLTFDGTDIRNTHEVWDMTSLVAFSNFNIRFVSVQPGWDWWWTVDNVCIHGSYVIPVELTSFAAVVNGTDAKLSWNTATETNNKGFDIERMNTTGDFESIGFVPGFGTTTEPKAYSFVDSKLDAGNFSYRLKQIDYDGSFNYSNIIELEVALPSTFALEQNYPNPFNPSTKIRFSIPVESEVKLNVYNALGQEVAELVNSRLKEGYHEVIFDAVSLTSGIYFYRLEAGKFVDVKKMIIIK